MDNEPNWQALVLAHLTNTEDPTQEDLNDPAKWRHAYATMMSMRGQADPPELLADLGRRMDDLERSADSTHRMHLMLFKAQDENTDKLTERLDFVEMQVRYGDTTKGESR